jgi:CubicO group peptidase (beta-lactamase class C family)
MNRLLKFTFLVLPITIFFIHCSYRTKPLSDDSNPKYSSDVEQRISKIMNNLQVESSVDAEYTTDNILRRMRYYHTPGVTVAVINDGKLEWARGFGVKDPDSNDSVGVNTLFQAGSVSKPVFALTVMKMKQDGEIDLDKDVNEYLKSWKVPANGHWQPVITLRQLLSHTAGTTVHGFPGYRKNEKIPTVPELLKGVEPANTPAVRVNLLPGTQFRYSGGGITIAQLAITDLLQKPFPTIIRQKLFDPLKLQNSTYEQPLPGSKEKMASTAFPWKGQPIPGGAHVYPEMAAAGLWTNPTELASLVLEVQKGIAGKSTFFKKETMDELFTPQKVTSDIGIGFFLQSKGDSTRFGHNGWDEGFVALLIGYKRLGKGAVIMVNSNEGYSIMDEIARAIAKEYSWPGYLSSSSKKSETITSNDYSGTYLNKDSIEMKIVMVNNQPQLIYQHQRPIPLEYSVEKYYFSPGMNFKLHLSDKELKFEQEGNSQVFMKKKS